MSWRPRLFLTSSPGDPRAGDPRSTAFRSRGGSEAVKIRSGPLWITSQPLSVPLQDKFR